MIEIKFLPISRWKVLKEIRLEALKDSPEAFSSSYEEENKLSESEWKRRIRNTLFAVVEDEIAGMAVFILNEKLKQKHVADIYGVYVKEKYRRRKIGEKLIRKAVDLIKEKRTIKKIKLAVNPMQEPAVNLYKKLGFEIAGSLTKEMKVGNKFYDELIMEKFLY